MIEHDPFPHTLALRPGSLPPETPGTFGDRLGAHTLLLGTVQGRLPPITFSSGHHKTGYGGVRWRLTDARSGAFDDANITFFNTGSTLLSVDPGNGANDAVTLRIESPPRGTLFMVK